MPRIPESENYDDDEVWLIPCDCQGNHYFKLVWWDDEPDMRYASLEYVRGKMSWNFYGIWNRLKDAFNAFTHNNYDYIYSDIVLNDKALKTLQDFLDARRKTPKQGKTTENNNSNSPRGGRPLLVPQGSEPQTWWVHMDKDNFVSLYNPLGILVERTNVTAAEDYGIPLPGRKDQS